MSLIMKRELTGKMMVFRNNWMDAADVLNWEKDR